MNKDRIAQNLKKNGLRRQKQKIARDKLKEEKQNKNLNIQPKIPDNN